MAIIAPQRHVKAAGETVNVAVDLRGLLDTGELLTGTPTVEEVDPNSPGDLTLTNKVVNDAALTINGESVAIGQAVQFTCAGGIAGVTYTIRITVSTDSTPAQVRIVNIRLAVVED